MHANVNKKFENSGGFILLERKLWLTEGFPNSHFEFLWERYGREGKLGKKKNDFL